MRPAVVTGDPCTCFSIMLIICHIPKYLNKPCLVIPIASPAQVFLFQDSHVLTPEPGILSGKNAEIALMVLSSVPL